MKRRDVVLMAAFGISLGGCGVVPLMGPAFIAASTYQASQEAKIDFRIKRNDPNANSLDVIRAAKTLALYPTREGNDGDSVDIFRQSTDVTVVSSTKTIEWVEKNKILPLKSMPTNDRTEAVARMARSVGADLGLFVIASNSNSEVQGVLHKTPVVRANFITYIVDAKTGKTLWVEDHQLYIEVSGMKPPGSKEFSTVGSKGIASRFMDLRLGRAPTAANASG